MARTTLGGPWPRFEFTSSELKARIRRSPEWSHTPSAPVMTRGEMFACADQLTRTCFRVSARTLATSVRSAVSDIGGRTIRSEPTDDVLRTAAPSAVHDLGRDARRRAARRAVRMGRPDDVGPLRAAHGRRDRLESRGLAGARSLR